MLKQQDEFECELVGISTCQNINACEPLEMLYI